MSSGNLSSDIIFEILSRTTLGILDTCKCISEEWNQLIYEPTFMPTYCQRTNSASGFVIQYRNWPDGYASKFVAQSGGSSSIPSLPSDMKILTSCDQGILCCVRWRWTNFRRNCRYYVCKPSTGQWQTLPNLKVRYLTVGVAMVVLRSSPLHYRIVRISQNSLFWSSKTYRYRCEIFESASWRWRETQGLTLEKYETIGESTPCIYANSSFHWKTTKDNVVAFHEPTESFHTFPLPELVHNYSSTSKILVDYQGNLGFCYAEETKLELWIWKGNLTENWVEWNKHMVVDIGGGEQCGKCLVLVGFDYSGVLLLSGTSQVLLYRVEDSSFSVTDFDCQHWHLDNVFPFRSDSETIPSQDKTTSAN